MESIKNVLENSVHNVQESVKQNILMNLEKFQRMKQDYERIIAP